MTAASLSAGEELVAAECGRRPTFELRELTIKFVGK